MSNNSATYFALGLSGLCFTDGSFLSDIGNDIGVCYERWDCQSDDVPCTTLQGGVGGVDSLDVYAFESEPNSAVVPVSMVRVKISQQTQSGDFEPYLPSDQSRFPVRNPYEKDKRVKDVRQFIAGKWEMYTRQTGVASIGNYNPLIMNAEYENSWDFVHPAPVP